MLLMLLLLLHHPSDLAKPGHLPHSWLLLLLLLLLLLAIQVYCCF
jgi:hypothetical protein